MAIQTIEKRRCDRCGGHVANDAERMTIVEEGPRGIIDGCGLDSSDLCLNCTRSLQRWWSRPRGAA